MAPPAEKYTLSQKIGLCLNSAYIYMLILQQLTFFLPKSQQGKSNRLAGWPVKT
jgi:hypothetical protein